MERLQQDALNVEGRYFTTLDGRVLWLRGVNLSGASKNPASPHLPSHVSDGFFDSRNISFVGRPFPLNEADEHFARLRHWGFNFFRFNVTWEAIEHSGPGVYDTEYLDYVIEILLKAKEYGLRCFIDPHQDMWSRFTGGSGAPGWTFEVVGFEPKNFAKTGAAVVHSMYADPANYPRMVWNTNVNKLAAGTMFILFFAGKTFAPNCTVDGLNVQDYLQSHFFNAFSELARRIVAAPGLADSVVLGYDTYNEPMGGWIGRKTLQELGGYEEVKNEFAPTPFQAMRLGEGEACDVNYFKITSVGSLRLGFRQIDPEGVRAWVPDKQCIWAQHGVWDIETRKLLRDDYFYRNPESDHPYEFSRDFWRPYCRVYDKIIRSVHQTAILFVEPSPFHKPPSWHPEEGDPVNRVCYSPHWYDGFTLVTKTYNRFLNPDLIGFVRGKYSLELFAIKIGERDIRQSVVEQLDLLRTEGLDLYGEFPCLMGEIGIPFDMNNKAAYKTGDYTAQIKSMDMTLNALERNLINFTLWNYCSDNNHQWGDGWNGEDLSIWSRDHSIPHGVTILEHPSEQLVPPAAEEATRKAHLTHLRKRSTMHDNIYPESTSGDSIALQPITRIHAEPESSTLPTDPKIAFSAEKLNQGARALEAFVRPYPILTPGQTKAFSFDMYKKQFVFTFIHPTPEAITFSKSDKPLIKFGWPNSETIASVLENGSVSELTELRTSVESLEVEFYIPLVHFPDAENIEIWSSDTPKSSILGNSIEQKNWRMESREQRAYWKCSCASRLLDTIDTALARKLDANQSGIYEPVSYPITMPGSHVEHTVIVRNNQDKSIKPMIDIGEMVLSKRDLRKQRRLANGTILNDDLEEDSSCCGICSVM